MVAWFSYHIRCLCQLVSDKKLNILLLKLVHALNSHLLIIMISLKLTYLSKMDLTLKKMIINLVFS